VAPKGNDGKLDHHSAMTGDDLREFVDRHLFPYLQGFKFKASGPNTLEYKIGEIFGEIKNKIQSGYTLRVQGAGVKTVVLFCEKLEHRCRDHRHGNL
jgi:hypothetical protein